MYDKESTGISYKAGFFMLIAFTIAGIVVASFISIPIWENMTGTSILKMEKEMLNPANSGAIKVIQCITAIIGFLLPSLITARMLNRNPMKLTGFAYRINFTQVALVLGIMIAALFASTFFAYLNEHLPISIRLKEMFDRMEKDYQKEVEAILTLQNLKDYLIALLVMALIPAVCEEALFRGGLQNYLTRWSKNPWLSIVIVSVLFSAAHFSFYGFLSRLFLGIVLGFIYHYSGRLWLSITAHFLNNALAVTAIYVMKQQGNTIETAVAKTDSSWIGVFAIPIVIAMLIYFKRYGNKPVEETSETGKSDEFPRSLF
jgi:membrane protease YdiL (CAAX protease family)